MLWISVALACSGGGGGGGGGLGGVMDGGNDANDATGSLAEGLMAAAEVAMTDATTDAEMLNTALLNTALGVGSAAPTTARPVRLVALAEGAVFALVLLVWAAALLFECLEAAEVTRVAAEAAEAAARASVSDDVPGGLSNTSLGSSRRRGRLSWLEHAAPICRAGTCAVLACLGAWRLGGTGAWLVAALTLSVLVHELAEASELARWARLSSRIRAGAPYEHGMAPPPRAAAAAPSPRRQALPLMRSQSPQWRTETFEHPVSHAVSSASELDPRRSELDVDGWEVLDDDVTSFATDPQYARLAPGGHQPRCECSHPRGHQPRSRRLSHEKGAGARHSAGAAARGEGVGGSSSSGGSGGGGDAGGGVLADTTTTATAPTAATSPLEQPATHAVVGTSEATPHPTSPATSPVHGGGGGSSSGDRSEPIPPMDRSACIEPLQTLQRTMALTSPMLSMAERLLRCLPHELRELARPIAVELLAVGVEKGAIDNDKFRAIVQALGATLSLVLTRTLLDPAGRMKLWLGLIAC